jgi:hypothetical protein
MASEGIGSAAGFLMMFRGIAIALLLAGTVANAGREKTIPAVYQGSWSMDPAYCNFEGDTLDNELYITANTVGFHAEHHRVKSVKVTKEMLTLSYFQLKDAYRAPPKTLKLSIDKLMLNDAWHRCPAPQSGK